eukprot:gene3264-2246_t
MYNPKTGVVIPGPTKIFPSHYTQTYTNLSSIQTNQTHTKLIPVTQIYRTNHLKAPTPSKSIPKSLTNNSLPTRPKHAILHQQILSTPGNLHTKTSQRLQANSHYTPTIKSPPIRSNIIKGFEFNMSANPQKPQPRIATGTHPRLLPKKHYTVITTQAFKHTINVKPICINTPTTRQNTHTHNANITHTEHKIFTQATSASQLAHNVQHITTNNKHIPGASDRSNENLKCHAVPNRHPNTTISQHSYQTHNPALNIENRRPHDNHTPEPSKAIKNPLFKIRQQNLLMHIINQQHSKIITIRHHNQLSSTTHTRRPENRFKRKPVNKPHSYMVHCVAKPTNQPTNYKSIQVELPTSQTTTPSPNPKTKKLKLTSHNNNTQHHEFMHPHPYPNSPGQKIHNTSETNAYIQTKKAHIYHKIKQQSTTSANQLTTDPTK